MSDFENLPDVLTVAETATLLRISTAACYEQIRQYRLPAVKLGRRLLIPKAALEKLLGQESGLAAGVPVPPVPPPPPAAVDRHQDEIEQAERALGRAALRFADWKDPFRKQEYETTLARLRRLEADALVRRGR
jgi:excisionase family DNA binding protein